jgi:hypothetical protein
VVGGNRADLPLERGADGGGPLIALGIGQGREADEVAEQEGVVRGGQRRATSTSAPRLGTLVIVLLTECSGSPTGLSLRRATSSRRTTDISNSANAPPRQRRTPPPKGIQV